MLGLWRQSVAGGVFSPGSMPFAEDGHVSFFSSLRLSVGEYIELIVNLCKVDHLCYLSAMSIIQRRACRHT